MHDDGRAAIDLEEAFERAWSDLEAQLRKTEGTETGQSDGRRNTSLVEMDAALRKIGDRELLKAARRKPYVIHEEPDFVWE